MIVLFACKGVKEGSRGFTNRFKMHGVSLQWCSGNNSHPFYVDMFPTLTYYVTVIIREKDHIFEIDKAELSIYLLFYEA